MARTRQFVDLKTDATRLADLENATFRFPPSEVGEYLNKGLAYVYAEILRAQDQPYYLSETLIQCVTAPPVGQPWTAPLPVDYLQATGVSWGMGLYGPWQIVERYAGDFERTLLLNASSCLGGSGGPFKYGFASVPGAFTQGTIPTTYSIEIVPTPSIASYIRVRYVPTCPRLVNDTDTFDGILGFEDAACTWAAILMRRKDDLETAALQGDMAVHIERIRAIARRRDRSAPPRVQLVREARLSQGWGSRRRGMGR